MTGRHRPDDDVIMCVRCIFLCSHSPHGNIRIRTVKSIDFPLRVFVSLCVSTSNENRLFYMLTALVVDYSSDYSD